MRGPAAVKVYAEIERVKARLNAVYQEALIKFAEDMQRPVSQGGNMPVKTEFLRSSLEASPMGASPPLVPHPGGKQYHYNADEVNSVLRTATIRKHRLRLTYTAEYAAHAEHNHRFRALAVQNWSKHVAAASTKYAAGRL